MRQLPYRVLERVRGKLAEKSNACANALTAGTIASMEQYRDKVGRIAAFNEAINLIEEELRKENDDDDDGS